MKTYIEKHGENDFSVWFAEIPDNDPLWLALVEKYGDTGCSVRGTLDDVKEEIENTLIH